MSFNLIKLGLTLLGCLLVVFSLKISGLIKADDESFIYVLLCLFIMPKISHLNFFVLMTVFFLWRCQFVAGTLVVVVMLLQTFNVLFHWQQLFYILLQVPTVYLFYLFLAITSGIGVSNAILVICPADSRLINAEERQDLLKWWSFIKNDKLFFDPDKDMNLDNLDSRIIEKSEWQSLSDIGFSQLQSSEMLSSSLTILKRRFKKPIYYEV